MSKRWVLILVLAILASWGAAAYAVVRVENARPAADMAIKSEGDTNFTNVVASGDVTAGDVILGVGVQASSYFTANVIAVTTTVAGADLSASDDLDVLDDARIADALSANSATITAAVTAADVTATDDLIVGDDAVVVGDLIANTGTITTLLTAADGNFSDDVVIVDDLNVKDVVVTTTLTLGAAFTNLRYGMAAAVTDGVTITHGLGGAPLFVVITPYGDGITVTANVAVSDTTSFTVDVPDGVTLANLGWFAGK